MPKFIPNRLRFIKELVKGKDVLDLGSVGCSFNSKTVPFEVMENIAKSIVGIDLRASSDKRIRLGNAETVNLHRKFDVIVAGDIMEHLYNPGLFLKNMKRHLKSEGVLFISTPNIRSRCSLPFYKTNPEHTLWHDKHTIKTLLAAHDFEIVDLCFYPGNKKLFFPLELLRLIIYFLSPSLSEGMIILAKLKSSV